MFYPTKLIFSLTVIIRAIFNEVLTEELAKEPVNVGYTLFVNLPRAEDLSPNKLFEVVLIFSTSDEPTLPSSVCEGGRELSMGYMLATPADEDNSSLTPLQSFKWRANFCPGEGTFLKNYISNITFSKVDTKVFFGDFTLKENVFMGTEETGTFFDADVSQNRFFKIDTFNDKTLATLGKLVSYFNFIATRNDKPSDYAETFDDNSSNGSNDPVVPKLSEAPDFKLFEIKKGSAFLKKREMNEFLKGAKLAFEEEDSSNQDDECTCKCTCSCGDDNNDDEVSDENSESGEKDTTNCVSPENNKENENSENNENSDSSENNENNKNNEGSENDVDKEENKRSN